ncbi:ESX-1 secretion-associated protein [Kibdelosporangium philippinense]|uniref:ESX-1 secretion-associated protein n=1 Tax=Kibdelosporangium philippinense TaxID=211113 RepID=A0ABS8Z3B0_9PSEU|nr:ESX-1 secretion-associated protein [Kibdelosporangium philippinense]MCE7002421.1 ESX-1 secretion-associated protein [Kibdelosporangium philippinense]
MSTPGYEIKDPSSLSRHAGKVGGVSDIIREANTAGQQVRLGGVGAYGLLCSPLMIPALQAFQGDMDDLLQSSADLAAALADGIKRAITDYDTIEQQIKAQNDELGWTS